MIQPWRPTTKGEDLLLLLTKSFRKINVFDPDNFNPGIEYSRSERLSEYFSAAYALNMFARMLRVGDQIVKDYGDVNESTLLAMLKDELVNRLDLSASDFQDKALDRIASAIVEAVYSSDQDISTGLRKLVKSENPKPECYLCGRALNWQAKGGDLCVSVDHIWPAAWGGDSVLNNLLPSCTKCNTNRNDIVGWQWVSAHSLVGPHDMSKYLLTLPRGLKASLHLRAAMSYASATRCTLKDAMILIGPILINPRKIDQRDTTDYFNLVAHDTGRYDPNWSRE